MKAKKVQDRSADEKLYFQALNKVKSRKVQKGDEIFGRKKTSVPS